MFESRFTLTVVLSSLGVFPVVAMASELALVPVASTGPHTIVGNEIVLAGGGQTVTFEIHASDWEPELLRGVQVVMDMNGFVSGMAGTALPLGWDRAPGDGHCLVTPCVSDAECPSEFTCMEGELIFNTCNGPNHNPEPGAFIDTAHPGYVFNGHQVLTAMDHTCYRYLNIVMNAAQSAEFTPPPKYVGTLVLVVSNDAEGTFTIGFEEDQCLFAYGPEESVVPSTFSPGVIRIVDPLCDNDIIEPGEECDGGLGCTNCLCDPGFAEMNPPSTICRSTCEANEAFKVHPSIINPPNGLGTSVSINGDRLLASAGGDDCEDGSRNCGSVFVFRFDGAIWIEEDRLTADDAQAWDFFGTTISQSGDRIIVGSTGGLNPPDAFGTAYVFRWDDSSTPFDPSDDFWVQEARLNAADEIVGDGYGFPVSISGDRAIVGARFDDDAGTSSGSAYVFRRDGMSWVQEAKLTADDAFGGDLFGWSVAISGDRIVVGARGATCGGVFNRCGAAYVYRLEGGGWVQEAKLLASDIAVGDAFGISIAIDNDRLIVGAYHNDDACPADPDCDSGSAYLFRREGTNWVEEAKLTASDAAAENLFSWNVSINGDRAIVGTRIGEVATDFGSTYVYQRNDNGTPLDPTDDLWPQTAKLTASDGAPGDLFAWAVSISGDWALAGASRDDDACPTPNCNTGSVYVFNLLDLCPICGDGTCASSESCTCPDDCGAPLSNEGSGATCADGLDNDCDGQIDSADPDCSSIPTVSTWGLAIIAIMLLIGAKVCFDRHRAGMRARATETEWGPTCPRLRLGHSARHRITDNLVTYR